MNYTIIIDPAFRDMIPPLSAEEQAGLEESIKQYGCKHPLTVWPTESGTILLDGHHRHSICTRLGLPYTVDVMQFPDRESAADWIDRNQLARRNLAPDAMSILRGRVYNRTKKQGARTDLTSDHSEQKLTTAEAMAKQYGVSPATIRRDGQYAEAVDALKAVQPGIEAAIIAGAAPPKAAVIEAARIVEAQPEMAREILEGKKPEESVRTFNPTNDNIGWAAWSWNPVTGCLHGCPYCYARDIAMRFTGHFKPEFHSERMDAPANTKPKSGPGGNRVFVGSMCDLFGDWVPNDWIHPVIRQAEKHPEWTFLFLTKNPKRYPDFNFPSNCWLGATADRQERVADIEESFARVRAGGTFVSCEPLLESVRFDRPDLIDWFLIGALSEGAKKVQPDARWVADLIAQATVYGKPWWRKDNLTLQQSPFDIAQS